MSDLHAQSLGIAGFLLSCSEYVIAKVDNKRGAQADTLAALFRKYTDRPVYREDTLADAFTRALNEKGSEGKLYCLGSLYLVGELKELIGGEDA